MIHGISESSSVIETVYIGVTASRIVANIFSQEIVNMVFVLAVLHVMFCRASITNTSLGEEGLYVASEIVEAKVESMDYYSRQVVCFIIYVFSIIIYLYTIFIRKFTQSSKHDI